MLGPGLQDEAADALLSWLLLRFTRIVHRIPVIQHSIPSIINQFDQLFNNHGSIDFLLPQSMVRYDLGRLALAPPVAGIRDQVRLNGTRRAAFNPPATVPPMLGAKGMEIPVDHRRCALASFALPHALLLRPRLIIRAPSPWCATTRSLALSSCASAGAPRFWAIWS